MAKIQRNFRIEKELDIALKNIAEEQGMTVSQLIELACYSIMKIDKKALMNRHSRAENKSKKMNISINTEEQTYRKLVKSAAAKNTSLSQEVNFILKASLTNQSFSNVELSELSKAMIDLNKLGNLLKLSLNNHLNTPELLEDIGNKIDNVKDLFKQTIQDAKPRKISQKKL